MDLFEAMRCAPTSRRFTDEPVAPEALQRVLDSARFAPSGGNRQGWRVVVVRDAERRRAIRDLYLPPWRAYMEQTGGAQMLRSPDDFDPRACAWCSAPTSTRERSTRCPCISSSACAWTTSS